MAHSFVAYIDESGDEGLVFRNPPDTGSSRWFVLSAVITRTDRDNELKGLADGIRHQFKMQPKQLMHFANLKHEQRVCLTQHIAQSWLTTSSVLVHEEQLQRRDIFQGGAFRLYFYATRLCLSAYHGSVAITRRRAKAPNAA
jgi:hypothetical protein